MNIFCLDENPVLSAHYHCNKHVVKMILEYAQLLSTTHRVLDGKKEQIENPFTGKLKTVYTMPGELYEWEYDHIKEKVTLKSNFDNKLYKPTHVNHPSTIWTRQSLDHYNWLVNLFIELCKEYTFRYGKEHATQTKGVFDYLVSNTPKNIPEQSMISLPTPAMPDYCKVLNSVVESYRNYYLQEKQKMLDWAGKVNSRETPYWVKF